MNAKEEKTNDEERNSAQTEKKKWMRVQGGRPFGAMALKPKPCYVAYN